MRPAARPHPVGKAREMALIDGILTVIRENSGKLPANRRTGEHGAVAHANVVAIRLAAGFVKSSIGRAGRRRPHVTGLGRWR